ncbi:MAG: MMPL family transporter [Pseudomonadales bacterium]|nr:MMPL family transporter [Pseudomonadales bacterium]
MSQPSISRSDRFATNLAKNIIQYRWWVLVFTLALVFSAASGVKNLEFSNDYRVFFSTENPELSNFEDFQDTYAKSDMVLFVIQAPEDQAFSAPLLASIEDLTKEAWKIPYAIRVDSITNFQYSYGEDDDLIVEDLIEDALNLSPEQIHQKKVKALAEPLLRGNLISATADTVGVSVTLSLPQKSMTEVPEAVEVVRALAAEFQAKHPDVHIALSGIVMLNNAFGEASLNDIASLMPLMYAMLIMMTLIVLRSFFGSISTLVVIAFSSMVAMGLAGFAGIPLTPVAAIAPTIIMTLAIADSIHILVSMLNHLRTGASKNDAIIETLRLNFVPVTLTSLTTIIGFLTLNFSDAPPFWHLGNITAMGIAAAWLLSLIFLPAMLAIFPIKVSQTQKTDFASDKLEQLADWVIKQRRPILIIGAAVTLFLTAMAPTIVLNDEFIKYFDEDIQFRRDADFTAEHLNGVYVVEYSIGSGTEAGIHQYDYLLGLENLTQWLRLQPEVKHVYSYTDIIKRLNRNLHNENPDFYALPTDPEEAAQYLLLYEFSLPYGMDLTNRVNLDKSHTRLTIIAGNISSVQMQDFNQRSNQWMIDNLPKAMHGKPTGTAVMFSYISKRNIESMMIGNTIAIFSISLIMLLVLRSVKLGFISLLANSLPIIMMFGVWAVLVGQVGMVASTVAAGTMGIVVDDTVHFLSKYLRAINEMGMNKADAIRYTFKTVGVAIVSTTIILVVGFSILMLSSFQLNAQTGSMSAITIVLALLFDFLLLPAVLMIGDKDSGASEPA